MANWKFQLINVVPVITKKVLRLLSNFNLHTRFDWFFGNSKKKYRDAEETSFDVSRFYKMIRMKGSRILPTFKYPQ